MQQFDIEIYNRQAEVALIEREVYGELVDNLFTRQAKRVPFEETIPPKAKKVLGIEDNRHVEVVRGKKSIQPQQPKEKKGHVLLGKAKCAIKGIMCIPYM